VHICTFGLQNRYHSTVINKWTELKIKLFCTCFLKFEKVPPPPNILQYFEEEF
jgi:hypothetical protein